MRFAVDAERMQVEFEECYEPSAAETCSVVDRASWRWSASFFEFVSQKECDLKCDLVTSVTSCDLKDFIYKLACKYYRFHHQLDDCRPLG